MNVRLRSSYGVQNLRGLSTDIRWAAFKETIAQATSIPASLLVLKVGFPPKAVQPTDDDALVFPALVSYGDTLTAERLPGEPSTPTPTVSSPPTPASTTVTAPQGLKPPDAAGPTSISTTTATTITRTALPTETPPLNDDGVVIRRVVPDDNSCLFNAVGYVLEGHNRSRAPQLRKLIADIVRSDPITYSETFLDKPNRAYAEWIMQPKSWGGAIELAIFSDYYQTEIAAFDISTTRMDCYGENKGYRQRVYLIYDGLHYDAFGLNFAPNGPEEFDTTIFSPRDEFVQRNAQSIVQQLRQQHRFTDTATFSLVCGDCKAVLVGEKGATEHAMATGHANFTEYK